MTTKQLIDRLERLPEDATIVIPNDDTYYNGDYLVTSCEYKDGYVKITTDYEKRT